MNLAYKYPVIFWNCACLITDSGKAEEEDNEEEPEEEVVDIYEPEDYTEYDYVDAPDRKTKVKKKKTKSTDYDKIAAAIGKMRQAGIKIVPPNINVSQHTFVPDVENNQILFGLKGMLNVGDELIVKIIENRPYSSPVDFFNKVSPNKQAMMSLIKGGTFDEMEDRKFVMAWYIWKTCDKKQNITLQNMASLIKYKMLPEETPEQIMARRIYEFNRYLKAICISKDKTYYKVDQRAINFLQELELEKLINFETLSLNAKTWDKVYQKWMDIFRAWIGENKEKILQDLNEKIFMDDWAKYAKGNLSSWEMEVLCFYYHDHELKNVNTYKYGLSDFSKLPIEPVVDRTFKKAGKEIKIFKLTKICGTCIAKNKNKGTVSLLTTSGVVNVKFRKEYFSMFDKRISEIQPDGSKKIKEKSWFDRGSMIIVQGMRSGDDFVSKKYNSSGSSHQLYKIEEVHENGTITIREQRYQGEEEEAS